MAKVTVEYLGNLRTKSVHTQSGSELITDAPTDNNGKGEAFSPTDLIGVSYVSCVFTIIGIYCNKNGLTFKNGKAEYNKVMAAGPRRIQRLEIEIDLSGNDWTPEQAEKIVEAGEACPVAHSISEDIELEINYTL